MVKYIDADEEPLPRATMCAAGSDGSPLSISTHTSYLPSANEVAGRSCFGSFLSVSHSVHKRSHVTVTHDALDLTIQEHPSSRHETSLYTAAPWTCSNLFNLDLTVQGPLPPPPQTYSNFITSLWSMYGWEADDSHSIGKLSSLHIISN